MRGRILVTSSSFGSAIGKEHALKLFAERGYAAEYTPVGELHNLLGDFDAVLVGTEVINGQLLDKLDREAKLRVVVKYGVGVDNIDLTSCTRRGILVGSLPTVNTVAVAEFALALILSSSRLIPTYASTVKAGKWERPVGRAVWGKTLGIIGTGAIGKTLARICVGLNMRVLGFDIEPNDEFTRTCGGQYVPLEVLLRESDFVSIHVPLTPSTRRLIGARELSLMKPTAILVNVSRGGIVDEKALHGAIAEGKLAGAALDVFEKEPPNCFELVQDSRVIATPHVAAYTLETLSRMDVEAVETVCSLLEGRDLRRALNPEALASRCDAG